MKTDSIRASGKIKRNMDSALSPFPMGTDMKENGRRESTMEKVYIFIRMGINTKDCMKEGEEKEGEFIFGIVEIG